jgi:chromate transporter
MDDAPASNPGSTRECFAVALRLGMTAFGGPVAHIGYFERCYVEQRQWLGRDDFAGMVALCQMVPGPASSQLGFLIGWRRGGWAGALAAWAGFTLPSAVLMAGLAIGLGHAVGHDGLRDSVLHGFKLVAVAVLAQAIVAMGRSLCPDRPRVLIGLAASALVLAVAGPWSTVLAVAAGALAGAIALRSVAGAPIAVVAVSRRTGLVALVLFAGLLIGAAVIDATRSHGLLALAALFYRSGALVFGGGHVVLPLLHDALVPGRWIDDQTFLAGYGAAQAMPGPLFTLAAWLGAACAPAGSPWPVVGLWSAVALVAMFAPGLLIVLAALPLWQWLGRHVRARGALAGINAAVVGVLAAVWCDPVARTALLRPLDWVIAAIGLGLLVRWRVPPVAVVAMTVLASVALG